MEASPTTGKMQRHKSVGSKRMEEGATQPNCKKVDVAILIRQNRLKNKCY